MLGLCLSTATAASFSSGGAFTPASVSGLVGWWESRDASATGVGNPVSALADKSSTGANLASTLTARPTLGNSGALYWLVFDGSNDMMSVNNAALRITGALTIVAASYSAAATFGGIASCQTGAGTVNAYEFRYTGNGGNIDLVDADGAGAATASTSTAASLNNWHVISIRRLAATNIEISIDKAREVIPHTKVPTVDASSAFVIGDRNATGIPLNGRIAAVLVYNRRLSDAELALAETYIGALAGLTL